MGLALDPDDRPAVVVSVTDEGAGIPEKQRAVIFARFWHGRKPGIPAWASTLSGPW